MAAGLLTSVLLVLVLLASLSAPATAADPTARLLSALDRCDRATLAVRGPRLDVLLALADGRSGRELKSALEGPRACIGHVTTYGDGENELVFVGGLRSLEATGALLWVDRGWWRIAALPLGYIPATHSVQVRGAARELFIDIASGGSAGTVGLLGVRIEGSKASVTVRLLPGGEIWDVRAIDADRVYVEGRLTKDRLLTWNSHVAWPSGAQWILERRGGRFELAAHRQSRDPYYVWTAFIGGLLQRDAGTMARFATPGAVRDGLALGIAGRWITPLELDAPPDFQRREHMSWEALPPLVRTAAPEGPLWGAFSQQDDRGRTLVDALVRFDRSADGWVITAVSQMRPWEPLGAELTP